MWSYREALAPPSLPRRLLIVGAGAIGIEFASFYRAVGAEVTVVEMAERILPVEDEEISARSPPASSATASHCTWRRRWSAPSATAKAGR